MPFRKVYEAEVDWDSENLNDQTDDGIECYMVSEYSSDIPGMFVEIKSYSNLNNHPEMNELVGKRIRVTIEVLDV